MNNSARWKALIEWLNDNMDATKEEILDKIYKIKKGGKYEKNNRKEKTKINISSMG